jgi:hypothetical protein
MMDFDGNHEVKMYVNVTQFVFILDLQKWDGP